MISFTFNLTISGFFIKQGLDKQFSETKKEETYTLYGFFMESIILIVQPVPTSKEWRNQWILMTMELTH